MNRIIRKKWILPIIFALLGFCGHSIYCQQPAKPEVKGIKAKSNPKSKSDPAAVNYYADAASYQNNGAFPLAIENWKKLLDEHADDPLASKAQHYLGVCYMQLEKPDYEAAISSFRAALADDGLDVREESLINLGWCYVTQSRSAEPGSDRQRELLGQSRDNLLKFLKSYGDGGYVDQALFYLGEIEYTLGTRPKAVAYYEQLLKSKSLAKSALRPDARYALGVALEEEKDDARALATFDSFLSDYPRHRLFAEVSLRKADLLLRANKFEEAERLLESIVNMPDNPTADYAMLRQGFAFGQLNKLEQAASVYRKLSEKFPNSKHLHVAVLQAGQAYFQLGKWNDARQEFEKIVPKQNEQSADAVHWISLTLQRQGRSADAIPILQNALKWAEKLPNVIPLRMDLADALYENPSKIDEARQQYESIASDFPDDPLAPRAAYNAAFASLQLGRLNDARRWSETFLKKYSQDPLRNDVAYVAAEALLQSAEHEVAAEAYRKLIAVDPSNPAQPLWKLRLAMALYLGGKYQPAIDQLESELGKFSEPRQRAESLFIMGACHLSMDEIAKAIAQLVASNNASSTWNQADEVLLLLSQARQRNNQPAEALAVLESILSQYPTSRFKPQVEYRIGQSLASMKKYADAIAKYRAVVANAQAKSLHDYAQYGIAWCQMQQDQFAAALESLKPLLDPSRTDSIAAEVSLAQGVCLRKLGKLDDATAALEGFLELQPTGLSLGNGLFELGMTYVEKKDAEKAIVLFERIVKEVPTYAALDKVLYELGWACTDKHDLEKGVKYFESLVEKFPSSQFSPEAEYQIAQYQYSLEKYAPAAKSYLSVLAKTKDRELREKALYKLGWSHFHQNQFSQAAQQFKLQVSESPNGPLISDGLFMQAECQFKEERYSDAFEQFQLARKSIESQAGGNPTEQVKTLIYLHGAQCLREQKKWPECEQWLKQIVSRYPKTPLLSTVLYELGYCKQSQNQIQEALTIYADAASQYRDESAARARYMMGEVYFAQRDFAKAIPEFQRVMFGFGGDKAPVAIKNWQARSAFEAGRCSDVLIQDLAGDMRKKSISTAIDFYKFIVDKHPDHELAKQAQARFTELSKLR